ncbi:MAG: aspartate 1-decarboxylase [Acidobacteriota bacterium]
MRRTLMKSKIHRATVTDADLAYVGSITLDPVLLEAADILVHEKVEIYNVTNGERFATYAIEGKRGEGEVVLNGAAAHRVSPGDLVILCSYAEFDDAECAAHRPKVLFVDEKNRIVEKEDQVVAHRRPLPVPQAV